MPRDFKFQELKNKWFFAVKRKDYAVADKLKHEMKMMSLCNKAKGKCQKVKN